MPLQMKSRAFTAQRPACARRALARTRCVSVNASKALIVNTKGGGHAFIGLHLAKALLARGHQVTIMNDGDQARAAWRITATAIQRQSGNNMKIARRLNLQRRARSLSTMR
jgi:hypothetical protein